MTRVSPPELARELPGPQASSSVTRAPRRRRYSPVQPPNAPAPTTTTCSGWFTGIKPPSATAAHDSRNTRRSTVSAPPARRGARHLAPPPAVRAPRDRRRHPRGSRRRRLAQGRADDLATALALSAKGPVIAAPAMHPRMWAHPTTQRNVTTLIEDGRVE